MLRFLSVLFLLIYFIQPELFAQDRLSGELFATRSEVIAKKGMAATNHPIASQIAIEILKKGGSAAVAAIAANAFIGFADPAMNGLGGDMYAIVWSENDKRLYGLNASGRSPGGMEAGFFRENGMRSIPASSPFAVTVPGLIDGWFELHERFGRLDMDELLTPAIAYAREGVAITPETADLMAYLDRDLLGGFMTLDDFASHSSVWVDPVSVNYRGFDVWELPPNVQGMSVLQMLNILEGYDLAGFGFGSVNHVHFFTEAKKLAYADLATYYGDPDFSELPVDELLSKEYAEHRRAEIDPLMAGSYGPGLEGDQHTIYLTVADKEGNMLSLIQSNSWLFGSLIMPPGLGFPLQNRGTGFTLEENHVNTYEPGKRPFHTIIPAFITKDGEPYVSFGLTGGDMQPQGHVQIVMNLIDFGMNIQEAGDAPRIRHYGSERGSVALESGYSYETVRSLLKMGHEVRYGFESFGGYQGILFDGTFYHGGSESRKDGQAAGY